MDLLSELRKYLIAQGVVRLPSVAGSLPPCWIEPQEGLPAPGEAYPGGSATQIGNDVVLGLFLSGGFPVRPYESFWRIPTVDLRIRGRTSLLAKDTEKAITPLVIDKREWQMVGLLVIESQLWRPMQPNQISSQGFDFTVSYSFQVFGP